MKIIWVFISALCMLATGCGFALVSAPSVAVYDFGIDTPKLQAARFSATLVLDDVGSPNWLNSPAIVYRLAYGDIARLHPYSLSRWAAPPPVLVTQRLRSALGKAASGSFAAVADGVRSDYVLRVELESFVQVVDAPNSARGIIRARASLIDAAQRSLRAQRLFEVEQPSPSVDAPGAVRALSAATDILIAQLIDWAARQTGSAR